MQSVPLKTNEPEVSVIFSSWTKEGGPWIYVVPCISVVIQKYTHSKPLSFPGMKKKRKGEGGGLLMFIFHLQIEAKQNSQSSQAGGMQARRPHVQRPFQYQQLVPHAITYKEIKSAT